MAKNLIRSEITRKLLHIAGVFTIPLARHRSNLTILLLACAIVVYIILEFFRIFYQRQRMLNRIVILASRGKESHGIVLGPITLALGIILALAIFPVKYAQVGIVGVTLGDGFSSLIGRIFGRHRPKFLHGKSLEGSGACFIASALGAGILGVPWTYALIAAMVTTIVEALPLKNFDNVAIPVSASFTMLLLEKIVQPTTLF